MADAIDDVDRNILSLLQQDLSLALDEIARRVGASKTPVWNRIRKMKASGLIKAEVAILDPDKLGLEACFFVLIRTSQHDAGWLDRFLKAVQSRPEVMEAHRLAGDIDYILKVRVPERPRLRRLLPGADQGGVDLQRHLDALHGGDQEHHRPAGLRRRLQGVMPNPAAPA